MKKINDARIISWKNLGLLIRLLSKLLNNPTYAVKSSDSLLKLLEFKEEEVKKPKAPVN